MKKDSQYINHNLCILDSSKDSLQEMENQQRKIVPFCAWQKFNGYVD